jgi:hypothetical protein
MASTKRFPRSFPSVAASPSRLLSLPSSVFPPLGRGKRGVRVLPAITGSRYGEAIESKTLCDMQVPKEYSREAIHGLLYDHLLYPINPQKPFMIHLVSLIICIS